MRILTPVRLIELDPMPCLASLTQELIQTHSLAFMFDVSKHPPSKEQLYEPVQLSVLVDQCPVQPADFVVVAISVIVAVRVRLTSSPMRNMGVPSEIIVSVESSSPADFGTSPQADRRSGPHPAIPTPVIVRAISVFFPVGFVVFLVVRNKVVERESVVAGHKVNALFGLAILVTINFRAAKDPIANRPIAAVFTPEKAANIVTKLAVPFFPGYRRQSCPPDRARPASQASAINFVPASAGSDSISQSTGGFGSGCRDASRERIEARSKRKPSTCISLTQ